MSKRHLPARPAAAKALSASVFAIALACAGCGGSDGTDSGPKPGGTLSGKYQLELKRSPACNPTAGTTAFSFPMVMTAAGSAPYPGVQVTLDGADPGLLELELKYTDYVLEGGFGTADNLASDQGPLVWVRAIGTGKVTQAADGRGEVISGSLRGLVTIGGDEGDPCNAKDHSFTLTPR